MYYNFDLPRQYSRDQYVRDDNLRSVMNNGGYQAIIDEYIRAFGQAGYENMLRNFGTHNTDFWSMSNTRRRNCLDKMINELTDKHTTMKSRHTTVPSKDGRKMERIWYTRDGRAMGISHMDDDHLHNTILFVDKRIAESSSSIGMNKDLADMLDELEDERIFRGLHLPLVPYKTLDYRKGN
jgi:hypothetical protein